MGTTSSVQTALSTGFKLSLLIRGSKRQAVGGRAAIHNAEHSKVFRYFILNGKKCKLNIHIRKHIRRPHVSNLPVEKRQAGPAQVPDIGTFFDNDIKRQPEHTQPPVDCSRVNPKDIG